MHLEISGPWPSVDRNRSVCHPGAGPCRIHDLHHDEIRISEFRERLLELIPYLNVCILTLWSILSFLCDISMCVNNDALHKNKANL